MSSTLLQALQHFTNSALMAAFVTWRDNVVELQVEAAQLQTACQRWHQSALAMAFASWVDWHLEQRDRWVRVTTAQPVPVCTDTADLMPYCAHGIDCLPAQQASLAAQLFVGHALLSRDATITQQLTRIVQGVKAGTGCTAVAEPPPGCSFSPLAQPQLAQE